MKIEEMDRFFDPELLSRPIPSALDRLYSKYKAALNRFDSKNMSWQMRSKYESYKMEFKRLYEAAKKEKDKEGTTRNKTEELFYCIRILDSRHNTIFERLRY